MYVKGVESSSIYTISAVMLCMSKVLKEVQNGLTHLIFNRKKFWKAETLSFPTIPLNTIYVKGVESSSK